MYHVEHATIEQMSNSREFPECLSYAWWGYSPGNIDIAGPDSGSPPRHCRVRKTAQTRGELSPSPLQGSAGWRECPPLYSYGRELFDAMLEAIDAAHESIYLETYIWKDDAVGQEFQEHLARKAEQGVAVYVIFDSFGNLVVPRTFKSSFHPAIHVLEYRAIRRPWQLLDLRRYALDHRKLLIVDGTTSFIGGYNLGSLYATAVA